MRTGIYRLRLHLQSHSTESKILIIIIRSQQRLGHLHRQLLVTQRHHWFYSRSRDIHFCFLENNDKIIYSSENKLKMTQTQS